MFIGPVFSRELTIAPRRSKIFVYRTVYAGVLFGVMCTAWLVLTGTQVIRSASDMARFGTILFQILAPLQLAMIAFVSALSAASAVAQEKDRKTMILLLLTRLNSSELVLGKLFAAMLHVMVMLVAGLPVFAMVVLFGGVSFGQVFRVFVVTLVTALAAGSLGSLLALWREKTFQTLAMTAMTLVFWLALCEAIGGGVLGSQVLGLPAATVATWLSPFRAVMEAASPLGAVGAANWSQNPVSMFLVLGAGLTLLLNVVAIWRVRVWNPSREVRKNQSGELAGQQSIWSSDDGSTAELAEEARAEHVDDQLRKSEKKPHRQVWKNPILWREICTWAYGKKIIAIRVVYLILAAMAAGGLYWMHVNNLGSSHGDVIPWAARPLVPFFLVSLVIVNALAVTAITTERDGRSLDLLLVTDVSPKEFLFGKLGGVMWVAKEMVLIPIVLCVSLWLVGRMTTEQMIFLTLGLVVMNLFVAVLGLHCGMVYANSRNAIGVSLGTVFFLFLGIATCILMMISFSGSFNLQLYPFLAFILGGGVGLYVSLGSRNPSPAILISSLALPFATFYAIVSYFLNLPLAVFLTVTVAYSFTTAAMMIPALSEFDFALGRSETDG